MDNENFPVQEYLVSQVYVKGLSPEPCGLLFTIVFSCQKFRHGKNRKSAEELHKKDSRGQTPGLLGKTETSKASVSRAENGEIQDYLCMENSGRLDSKLWN